MNSVIRRVGLHTQSVAVGLGHRLSVDLAACLGTLEMSKSGSPNSNTNRDSTLTLSEDY